MTEVTDKMIDAASAWMHEAIGAVPKRHNVRGMLEAALAAREPGPVVTPTRGRLCEMMAARFGREVGTSVETLYGAEADFFLELLASRPQPAPSDAGAVEVDRELARRVFLAFDEQDPRDVGAMHKALRAVGLDKLGGGKVDPNDDPERLRARLKQEIQDAQRLTRELAETRTHAGEMQDCLLEISNYCGDKSPYPLCPATLKAVQGTISELRAELTEAREALAQKTRDFEDVCTSLHSADKGRAAAEARCKELEAELARVRGVGMDGLDREEQAAADLSIARSGRQIAEEYAKDWRRQCEAAESALAKLSEPSEFLSGFAAGRRWQSAYLRDWPDTGPKFLGFTHTGDAPAPAPARQRATLEAAGIDIDGALDRIQQTIDKCSAKARAKHAQAAPAPVDSFEASREREVFMMPGADPEGDDALKAAPEPAKPDKCARCGHPASEHHYDGACYGMCGEFEAQSAKPEELAELRAATQEAFYALECLLGSAHLVGTDAFEGRWHRAVNALTALNGKEPA